MTIYSLESFVYKILNFAARKQDQSKVATMGPYALALADVITYAQTQRNDGIKGSFTGYRGVQLIPEEIG